MTAIPLLPAAPVGFPDPAYALTEPDGLVAAGGALTTEWLLEAYGTGIFPWFDSDDDHILWWSPSRRAVLEPGAMHVSKSLAKRIRNAGFTVTVDTAFAEVVAGCQAPRERGGGTWITPNMQQAYATLFARGFAHSVEVWDEDGLCGGLYGVSLGTMFFGESMFSRTADASKVAFYHLQRTLAEWQFALIDCQIMNPHLERLGVTEIPRAQFLRVLERNARQPTRPGPWRFE